MDHAIRVLNLFTVLNRGGAETMCMNLYRHIDRKRVQFDFLVYHEERGIYEDEIEALGGHVYRIPHLKNLPAHINAANAFFVEHREYTAVHNHMQCNGAFICRAARKSGIGTIIYHSHSGPLSVFENGMKIALRRIRNNILNRIALSNSTVYMACGQNAGLAIPEKYKPIKIIQNAIDLDMFKYDPSIRERIRKNEKCGDKLIIGHVGRIDAKKNQSFAIDVMRELIRINPKTELWLVGDGVLRQQIEEKAKNIGIADKVRFWGVRTDISELLQAMDVYLFPSIAEGLPVACIEAQAAGLPCVFSDGFDPHTVVTDNCQVLPLKQGPGVWAKTVQEMAKRPRVDKTEMIRQAGYDIAETSRFMQEFYLSRITE